MDAWANELVTLFLKVQGVSYRVSGAQRVGVSHGMPSNHVLPQQLYHNCVELFVRKSHVRNDWVKEALGHAAVVVAQALHRLWAVVQVYSY